mgnify:FL=1
MKPASNTYRREIFLAILVAVGAGIGAWLSIDRLIAVFDEQTRSRDVLYWANRVLADLSDAETGQRGYLITGKEEFLESYTNAPAQLATDISNLRRSLARALSDPQIADRIETLSRIKLDELAATLALYEGDSFGAAQEKVIQGRGKRVMDSLRSEIGMLQEAETRLYSAKKSAAQKQAEITKTVSVIAFVTFVAILGLASRTILRENAERQQAETELRRSWQELEHRVEERTEELARAKEAAEAADRAKSDFLATMSHEIRTPMNSVIGFSNLLLASPLNAEQRSQIGIICESAETLLALINDILDFSKIEAGMITLEQQTFDLRDVLARVRNVTSPLASAKGIFVRIEIAETVPAFVIGDSFRTQQILLNLAANAVKFTEIGGVTITAARNADFPEFIEIRVADTGIGMTDAQLRTLFQPFSQADSSITRRYGGTGLGLALSKRLVDAMQGSFSVTSTPGLGSVFVIRIPCVTGPAPEASPAQDKFLSFETFDPAALPRKPRILAVDDHAINLRLLSSLLQRLGCEAQVARSGEECLAMAAPGAFDLIFMDVQMPGIDGLETTRCLRQREAGGPRAYVVGLTAQALTGDREKCLAAGMDDYLSKPYQFDAIADIIWKQGSGNSLKDPEASTAPRRS